MRLILTPLKEEYKCKKEWSDDCFLKCSNNEYVISKDGNYKTASFEVVSKNPKTYIRGEGQTIEEAEEKVWNELQGYKSCNKHEFERGQYTNGTAICKHCNLLVYRYFEPSTTCKICGNPTTYTSNKNNEWYCKLHYDLMPYEEMTDWQIEDFERTRTERISRISDFIYLEDRDYYLEHNPLEMDSLDTFMKSVFEELALKLGFNNIDNADIGEKYIFSVKNFDRAIPVFANKHEYVDYITYEDDYVELIAVRLNEQRDVSPDGSRKKEYIKTGREIYLFSLSTDALLKYIKNCTK